jgi:hypothetical protein
LGIIFGWLRRRRRKLAEKLRFYVARKKSGRISATIVVKLLTYIGIRTLSPSTRADYCLSDYVQSCDGLQDLFINKGCYPVITDDIFREFYIYTFSDLDNLALDLIPKCVLLVIYGALIGCFYPLSNRASSDIAESESASGGGTIFGVKLNDLNELACTNLPKDFTF